MTAAAMIAKLLVEIPIRFPGARVWRQNSGVLPNPKGQPVRFGVVGCADVSGIMPPRGRRIEIEVKAEGDKMRKGQPEWRQMILTAGGIHIKCRDVEECLKELEKYR